MTGKRVTGSVETTEIEKVVNDQVAFTNSKFYYSTKQVQTCNNILDINKLNIIYTNADCYTNKKTDLLLFLNSLSFTADIIVITEVNPKVYCELNECEFYIPGYSLYSCNLGVHGRRGIFVYITVSLASTCKCC